jgi:Zn-dependent M28 family amino/carboxypeptidase
MQVKYQVDDLYGYNNIAEIPGTDLKDEVVMIGAHIDSWHAATGATDNASGSAVMMEVMRILKAIGVEPRRTIRIGLWGGEEQGLHGSREYVADHFASAPGGWGQGGEVERKEGYDKFSAYYNIDNGTGQVRGIFLQQNEELRLLFRTWLQPFAEWDATTVTYNNTGSTDHVSFDRVGLAGFQFIQDPIEYSTMTHHSNMDFYERLVEQDLMRTAVIVAAFAYHTAMLDEKLPRK